MTCAARSRVLFGRQRPRFRDDLMSAAVETAVMQSPLRAAVHAVPYLYWYALASNATLMWIVPLAIAPGRSMVVGARRRLRRRGWRGGGWRHLAGGVRLDCAGHRTRRDRTPARGVSGGHKQAV